MKKVIIFVLLSSILVACGGATPTPDTSAIQTQAVQDAIATMTAQAPTGTATPTNTPAPISTPTPRPTNTPTKTPTPFATATPIELISYENDQLSVVFKYPSDCEQPEFSSRSYSRGEWGTVDVACGLNSYFGVHWEPPIYETLEEEAEPSLLEDLNEILVRHEPVTIGGQPGYLTETRFGTKGLRWLEVMTRYEGYSYEFTWFSGSHEGLMTLFDLMLPSIRFVSAPAPLPTPTATPKPPTPTSVPPTPTAAVSWQQVATFHGSDTATTAPFDIQGDAWRVRWTATPRWEGDLPFDIYGFREGQQPGQAIPIVFVMSSGRGGSGVNYAYTGPGAYYLLVNSAGFDWTIIVEDQY